MAAQALEARLRCARRTDNHWFDCLADCAVAASMAGMKVPEEAASGRQRKLHTQDDLRKKDTWQNL